jgi:AraC-like DNA-binding protein
MTVLLGTFRMLAGDRWTPRKIHFAHEAPARASEHSRIFGCRVVFASEANALVFEHDFVERAVPAADEKLYRVLKRHMERMLGDAPRRDDLAGIVIRAIGQAMAEGEPKLKRIAARLAVSPRTLERRLKARGASYRALLDDTRKRFAVSYLSENRHSLSEIAFLLGYSEVSAFNRAFKRWTDSTPSEYRAR